MVQPAAEVVEDKEHFVQPATEVVVDEEPVESEAALRGAGGVWDGVWEGSGRVCEGSWSLWQVS